jgi:hypothetical protein
VSLFEAEDVLGEVAIVIGEGRPIEKKGDSGKNIKLIANQLAEEWDVSKREAYNMLMTIKPE